MKLIEAGHFVLKKLNEAGYEAFFVGGMVRDQLLGRVIYDIDITTAARPETVQSLFERTFATGIAHGTITVVIDKIPVEVTTYRVESHYLDYRHPESVTFTSCLDADLQRRDFTINGIAQDLAGHLYDPIHGLEDLKSRTLRAIGDANDRFMEDPLRMLRAIRFVSKLDFNLDADVYLAIKNQRYLMTHLAKERIKKELEGIMEGSYKDRALALLFETQLLDGFTVFQSLNKYQTYSFVSLHRGLDFFVLTSLEVGDLERFLSHWPFSKEEKRFIKLIKQFMKTPTKPALIQYRFGIEAVYLYHRICCFLEQKEEIFTSCNLVIESRKDIEIETADLMRLTNRKKGPWVGQLLELIEEAIISGNLINNKEKILEFVKRQGVFYEE